MGDPEPKCSEFMPSALVWLLGPCPWLFPGNIASNYTTRGAQPLRYHAKFQTDLITTTSRTQTQWGRPPPRRVFKKQNTNPKQRFSLHKSLGSFPHRKQREQSKFAGHAACTVLCWSSCTCPVLKNGSGISQIPNALKTLIFTLMNSCWLNSSPFPKHSQITFNSSQIPKTFSLSMK